MTNKIDKKRLEASSVKTFYIEYKIANYSSNEAISLTAQDFKISESEVKEILYTGIYKELNHHLNSN